jgi:hypothetical protein
MLAHEQACEGTLAAKIADELAAGRLPDLKAMRAHFAPQDGTVPEINFALASLAFYDEIAASSTGSWHDPGDIRGRRARRTSPLRTPAAGVHLSIIPGEAHLHQLKL